jgi:hypothetical protein
MRAISAAASVTTRDLDVVQTDLDQLRARRNNTGREDANDRWAREALEAEERRAREREKSRNLTDFEAVQQKEYLRRLVADARAEIYAHIESREGIHVDVLGETFGKERKKMREQLMQRVDERLEKLRTGPTGPAGAKGDYGARGPEGRAGPAGKPGSQITSWRVDKARYVATPVMSDGTPGPDLELRDLFVQFIRDVK